MTLAAPRLEVSISYQTRMGGSMGGRCTACKRPFDLSEVVEDDRGATWPAYKDATCMLVHTEPALAELMVAIAKSRAAGTPLFHEGEATPAPLTEAGKVDWDALFREAHDGGGAAD